MIFHLMKQYKWMTMIALLLMFLEFIVDLIQPQMMALIIDHGVLQSDNEYVIKLGMVMVALTIGSFVVGILNTYFAAHVSQQFGYTLRERLFSHVQTFSVAQLQRFSTATLVTRLTNDCSQIQNFLFMSLRIALRAPLLTVGTAIMIIVTNVQIGSILLLVVPILLVFLYFMIQRSRRLFFHMQKKLDRVNFAVRDTLTRIRFIRSFVKEEEELASFQQTNEDLMNTTIKTLRFMELTLPIVLLGINMCIIFMLVIGKPLVQNSTVPVGDVVAILNYSARLGTSFHILSFILNIFSRARASANRVEEVFAMSGDERIHFSNKTMDIHELMVQDVTYTYDNTSNPALQPTSFCIQKGEHVAIVGETGSGKTTLLLLLLGLLSPTEGVMYANGKKIKQEELFSLRSSFGYVSQEIELFSGTLLDNIAFGREAFSADEVEKAVQTAQLKETIAAMPSGYDTVIGQRGVTLSGGQKQRIAIARALLKQPQFLLFDDSTSALDTTTEEALFQALEAYECGKIIVTSKIQTAARAERIFVLANGEIIASGSHETLMTTCSWYEQVATIQAEGALRC